MHGVRHGARAATLSEEPISLLPQSRFILRLSEMEEGAQLSRQWLHKHARTCAHRHTHPHSLSLLVSVQITKKK